MDTSEIIKKAVSLPFRAYKGFILVIFLFFLSEIVTEIFNQIEIGELTMMFYFAIPSIFAMIILGFCITIVYHYIDDSFDIREVSLKTTTKAGFKDTLIEFYYYSLTIILTTVITYSLGIYRNIDSLLDGISYVDYKVNTLTFPELLKLFTPDTYHQLASSVIATLAIFVILFAIFFSYCSLAKIRLKETGDIRESMDFINLTKIIKRKGIRKYLSFVILTFIILASVLFLMKALESHPLIGSIISAFTEAFALFFILDSFSLYYYS